MIFHQTEILFKKVEMILSCAETIIENMTNNIKHLIATMLCDWLVHPNLWKPGKWTVAYISVLGIDAACVSVIFRLDFVTVPTL
jgi:hypothetical protein